MEGHRRKIVVTKPLSLEGESDLDAPNLLQRILSLFKNVRPGSDLSRFQVPALFNLPKSQLQCYGESVYSTGMELIRECNRGQSPLDRLIAVMAWSISTTRPATFGVAPYNPILGETHHVSKGTLNVLLEQISHHPPVTALHATDEKENIEMVWCQQPVPKFYGTSIEAKVHGKRQLKLLNHGETYEMNCPHLLFRIIPVPSVDWKVVKGKIRNSSTLNVLYKVDGHWNRTIKVKDTNNGKVRVIYDAKEVINGLQAPMVKDAESVWPTESAYVWSEVSEAIMKKEWEKAREAKHAVEERQRELLRERESKGQTWISNHFLVSNTKVHGWECSPMHTSVSDAPIIAE
ncbi:hypothetical protein AAHE18_04G102500 [Arachis hypogaea]